jgi:hypothetical protein
MHVSPMCSRIVNMKNYNPKPHRGDIPQTKKNLNFVHIELASNNKY